MPRVVNRKTRPPNSGSRVTSSPGGLTHRNTSSTRFSSGSLYHSNPESKAEMDLIASQFPEVLARMEERRRRVAALKNVPGTHEAGTRALSKAYQEDREDIRQAIIEVMETLQVPGSISPNQGRTPVPLEETKARYTQFFTLLSEGASLANAIAVSSVPHRHCRMWLRRGGDKGHNQGVDLTDEAEEPYRTFALTTRAVMAMYNHGLLQKITKAANSDWKAGAWLLERRDPDTYGVQKTDVRVGVQADGQAQVLIYVPSNGRESDEDLTTSPDAEPPSNVASPLTPDYDSSDDVIDAEFREEGGK